MIILRLNARTNVSALSSIESERCGSPRRGSPACRFYRRQLMRNSVPSRRVGIAAPRRPLKSLPHTAGPASRTRPVPPGCVAWQQRRPRLCLCPLVRKWPPCEPPSRGRERCRPPGVPPARGTALCARISRGLVASLRADADGAATRRERPFHFRPRWVHAPAAATEAGAIRSEAVLVHAAPASCGLHNQAAFGIPRGAHPVRSRGPKIGRGAREGRGQKSRARGKRDAIEQKEPEARERESRVIFSSFRERKW